MTRGDPATFLALVVRGSAAELSRHNVPLTTEIGKGSVLGHTSLFCGGLRPATVIVKEPTVVVLFPYARLLRLARKSPEVGLKVLRLLACTSVDRLLRTVALRAEPLALHAQLAARLRAIPPEKDPNAPPPIPGRRVITPWVKVRVRVRARARIRPNLNP